MADFGYILLLGAMVVAAYTAGAAIVGHHRQSQRLATSAQYGTYAVFGLLSAASLLTIYLFVANDYSVKYVQHYSDRSMPLFYKVTAFWGGQDGSLLFWVWVMSIWCAVAVYQNRERNRDLMPYTIVAMMSVALFFLVLMIFAANPFETYLAGAPTDGRGLNPLLQNPYMVTHPPSLYLGYIGWTIPFCFAMGALAHGQLDYGWIRSMRRWCLVAWVFLAVGLTLGGLWAYEELGWGGYWAWDPVENAAFVPFLTGTAFIHSIQVQERREIFKVWNMVLIILTFMLTLLGTMMTRSGIVQSVHAFAQSSIGDYFLVYIAVVGVVCFGLVIYRSRELAPKRGLESILSREFAFLLSNWILLAAAFFVVFATLFPAIFKWISKEEVNVGASFFNLWMVPLGIGILFLMGVGPLLSWRKSTGKTIREQFSIPAVVGALSAGVLILVFQVTAWAPLTTLSLCAFVSATLIQELLRGTRHRMKTSQETPLDALMTLIARARRRYGGYVVHFGVVVMYVGFAGTSFNLEREETLAEGQKTSIGRYEVRLDGIRFEDDGQKNMVTADVTVFEKGTDKTLGVLSPGKWAYRKPEDQVTTEVDKLMSVQDDLYLVLGGYDSKAKSASLQLKVNPLVNFVWLGCSFLLLGFAICVLPERRKSERRVPAFRRWIPAWMGVGTSLLVAVVSLLLAFV